MLKRERVRICVREKERCTRLLLPRLLLQVQGNSCCPRLKSDCSVGQVHLLAGSVRKIYLQPTNPLLGGGVTGGTVEADVVAAMVRRSK